MKIELTGVVRNNADSWIFETMVNNKPYKFGLDNHFGSAIPTAIDEILDKFGEPLTESGQSVRITIER